MKFTLYTLQNGGTQVAEKECHEFELFAKIEEAIKKYDSEKHYWKLDKIYIYSDTGHKLVCAQNRLAGGYSWCCWSVRKHNTVDKKWQREFNKAFNNGNAFMGW